MGPSEALVAVAAGVPSFLLGYLAYRRSVRVDAVAAQVSVSDDSRAGVAQVVEGLNRIIDGLNRLLDQVQEENAGLRAQLTLVIEECGHLRHKVAELQKRYGHGHDED